MTKNRLRSKGGCKSCRSNKKKCDEKKPVCSTCLRKKITCIWPTEEEMLDKRFKKRKLNLSSCISDKDLVTVSNHLGDKKITSGSPVSVDFVPVFELSLLETVTNEQESDVIEGDFDSLVLYEEGSNYSSNKIEELETENDYNVVEFDKVQESNNMILTSPNSIEITIPNVKNYDQDLHSSLMKQCTFTIVSLRALLPGLTLDDKSSLYIESFMNNFLPAITPPHAHSDMRPSSVFVPYVTIHQDLIYLFLACGAIDNSWHDPASRIIAQKYYNKFVKSLQITVKQGSNIMEEDWFFMTIQLLCLLEKHMGAPSSTVLKHVTAGYQVIQKKKQDSLLSKKVSKIERVLTESFLYNYLVLIMFSKDEDLKYLPPRGTFEELKSILKVPIINENDSWSDHPVFGGSVDLFCNVEKILWLYRKFPLNHYQQLYAADLLSDMDSWVESPKLSNEPKSYMLHREASFLYYLSCKILLLKLLDTNIREYDEKIRNILEVGILRLLELELKNSTGCVGCILAWPIAMLGFASSDIFHKTVVRQKAVELCEVLHAGFAKQVLDLLDSAWSVNEFNETLGLDILYRRDILQNFAL